MTLTLLIGSALLAPGQSEVRQPGPPERIVLPVIQPGCDRAGDVDTVVVCGRTDRRYRIDRATLSTVRAIEHRKDNAKRPRPAAITGTCEETGPMGCRGHNVLPVSSMALRAIGLVVKAIRGEDLRPALRQGPTDYEIYQQAQARAQGPAETDAPER